MNAHVDLAAPAVGLVGVGVAADVVVAVDEAAGGVVLNEQDHAAVANAPSGIVDEHV